MGYPQIREWTSRGVRISSNESGLMNKNHDGKQTPRGLGATHVHGTDLYQGLTKADVPESTA